MHWEGIRSICKLVTSGDRLPPHSLDTLAQSIAIRMSGGRRPNPALTVGIVLCLSYFIEREKLSPLVKDI